MADSPQMHTLPMLVTDKYGKSVWIQSDWPIEERGRMLLSPRIDCSSLRLRRSEPGYQADWHVAGDATLIVIRSGRLKLILRDGSERTFNSGEAFIAADVTPDGQDFDPALHGHRAEVVGKDVLEAIHIKLAPSVG